MGSLTPVAPLLAVAAAVARSVRVGCLFLGLLTLIEAGWGPAPRAVVGVPLAVGVVTATWVSIESIGRRWPGSSTGAVGLLGTSGVFVCVACPELAVPAMAGVLAGLGLDGRRAAALEAGQLSSRVSAAMAVMVGLSAVDGGRNRLTSAVAVGLAMALLAVVVGSASLGPRGGAWRKRVASGLLAAVGVCLFAAELRWAGLTFSWTLFLFRSSILASVAIILCVIVRCWCSGDARVGT